MSNKAAIINRVKQQIRTQYDMPVLPIKGIEYADKIAQFKETLRAVGGEAVELKQGEDLDTVISLHYPEAKTIASNLEDTTLATISPDNVNSAHDLKNIDLAIVRGEIGVAENACVWVPQLMKERVICFISEYLVILLDKNSVVNNMHEAYEQINFHDSCFGVFISGPSKTADIEQALVVGAHGPKGVLVILL
ncbi:LUD domain-containing protein [Massilibacteroides sp.]|uniref:LutC/YkgG family protein n=1 Tax=Massilibacteroides sp. TaxID=2034766 RepID=UPI002619C78C|nr:LUD domain-containing protein [Massilibacteroides sp.]MDD4514496.1 LUD domain-containing protein [Massilibacteroides sp.]